MTVKKIETNCADSLFLQVCGLSVLFFFSLLIHFLTLDDDKNNRSTGNLKITTYILSVNIQLKRPKNRALINA